MSPPLSHLGLRRVKPRPPTAPGERLGLVWLAGRDPFAEAERFAKKESDSVYGLLAWEVDFIKELLTSFEVDFRHATDPSRIPEPCHILVYSVNQFTPRQIRRGLRRARPRVVFHLSDEWGTRGEWHRILRAVPLVLRQHHFDAYPSLDNIKTFPLGYMEGMLKHSSIDPDFVRSQKPMQARRFTWSFVGTIKGPRSIAIEAFSDLLPNHVGTSHPLDMTEVYLDSRFVLCPAGNVNLLCFRNFEASICGSIPVVAGRSAEEYHEGVDVLGSPPWIFRESWREARKEVRRLLEDPHELEARRHAVLDWWRGQVETTVGELQRALTPAPPPDALQQSAVVVR